MRPLPQALRLRALKCKSAFILQLGCPLGKVTRTLAVAAVAWSLQLQNTAPGG
jgi:hypothetical protein